MYIVPSYFFRTYSLYDSTINYTNLQGDLTFELREYPSVKWVCTEGQYDMAAEVREVNFI